MFENKGDHELLEDFVVESSDHLADIETDILAIEEAREDLDLELVNRVFHGVHSIKGAAGFLGLDVVRKLAHSMENVLHKIRCQELPPNSENTNIMLRAGDTLGNLIGDVHNSNSFDVTEHVDALEELLVARDGTPVGSPKSDVVDDTHIALQEAIDLSALSFIELFPNQESLGLPKDTDSTGYRSEQKKDRSSGTAPGAVQSTTKPISRESSIRVPVEVLDKLVNLAGEFTLNRNQLQQAIASGERQRLEAIATELDQLTRRLQKSIVQTRMQPIGRVFGRFPRLVRDLSSELGKEVRLEIEGKDIELDKTIVTAIRDPLTHLIRNSVDHGIEDPSLRKQRGKEPVGSVWLRAYVEAGKVCIEIQDNGAGIDPDELKRIAIDNGVLSPERADQMNDSEAIRLLLHPEFSAIRKGSSASARRIGMDVVRTSIERLGGSIEVESIIGAGTRTCITLPLTLSIIPSLIMKCGDDRFAIPQASVAESIRLRPDEVSERIGKVHSTNVLHIRGNELPLLNLQDLMGVSNDSEESVQRPMNIVVVTTDQARYGLVVDDIQESEGIVVKPLGRHLNSCVYFAGATILGDGHIAFILDPAGIATESGVKVPQEPNDQEEKEDEAQNFPSEGHTLLLFSSNPTDHFAVPMDIVERIDRVRADQIDSLNGQQVLQYNDTSMPLISVSDHLVGSPATKNKRVYIVVFTIGEREIGLIAPQLDDIRSVSNHVDTDTITARGVAGSLVVDEQTTLLLDLFELARASHPHWFEDIENNTKDAVKPTRVMLVEDSSFFRKQVAGFLGLEGWEVMAFANGQEAWQALKTNPCDFDIILSDLEMPVMNGIELCRRIRADRHLDHLPLIALTSLENQDALQRGVDAGFNDYQVKMHRDNLIRAIKGLSSRSNDIPPSRSDL